MSDDRPQPPTTRWPGIPGQHPRDLDEIKKGGYQPPPSSEGPKNPPVYTNPINPAPPPEKPDTPEKP